MSVIIRFVTRDPMTAFTHWVAHWRPVLPLMTAELILWLGFGAFLPVLPLFVTSHGVDIPTLGIVIAAWPAARLIGEPVFGWLADRTRRVPLMVVGLLLSAVFAAAPLAVSGVVPFVILRGLAGLSAAMYDPAARGYLLDATPSDRRGEAFGIYGAAQMAGFLLGPALGALAAAATGRPESVFILGGISVAVAGVVVAFAVPELPHGGRDSPCRRKASPSCSASRPVRRPGGRGAHPPAHAGHGARRARHIALEPHADRGDRPQLRGILRGRNLGGHLEPVHAGARRIIEFIGFTFVLFSLPVLLVSPFVGRLVDRRGPIAFIVLGSLTAVATA